MYLYALAVKTGHNSCPGPNPTDEKFQKKIGFPNQIFLFLIEATLLVLELLS